MPNRPARYSWLLVITISGLFLAGCGSTQQPQHKLLSTSAPVVTNGSGNQTSDGENDTGTLPVGPETSTPGKSANDPAANAPKLLQGVPVDDYQWALASQIAQHHGTKTTAITQALKYAKLKTKITTSQGEQLWQVMDDPQAPNAIYGYFNFSVTGQHVGDFSCVNFSGCSTTDTWTYYQPAS